MLVSVPFKIDIKDQAKVLSIKIAYRLSSDPGAANRNFSGTSSNSFGIAIYDATADTWIQPAGYLGFTQSSGAGVLQATFQTTSSSTNYRLAIYNMNSIGGALTMLFDDIQVGTSPVAQGTPVTDWQSYTPTWSSSGTQPVVGNGSVSGKWRRVGDTMEISAGISAGSTTTFGTGNYLISIPSGYSIDTSKLTNGASTAEPLGTASILDGGTLQYAGNVQYSTTTTVSVNAFNSASTYASLAGVNASAPISFGDTDGFTVIFRVPVTGWSSNLSLSQDSDTRVCAARMTRSGSQSITSTAATKIQLNVTDFDSHGAADIVTNYRWVAPISGYYSVTADAYVGSAGGDGMQIAVYKNGASNIRFYQWVTTAADFMIPVSGIIRLNAGDYLELYIDSLNDASYSVTEASLNIQRISGPSTIAASETVSLRYYSSSTSISGSLATIVYSTKSFDSHGIYSSGTATIPTPGKYQVNAALQIQFTSGASVTSGIEVQVNGTAICRQQNNGSSGNETTRTLQVSDIISCNAGDTVRVQVQTSGLSPSIVSDPTRNYFSLVKVGN
jgi:hypothetical protein